MASLQRRFTARRSPMMNPTDIIVDREEFFKVQSTALQKAINQFEQPSKEKHVRILILGTHQEKGSGTFWAAVHRLNLESNRYVTWKFCHVLHKLLRDGSPHCLTDGLKYRTKLKDLGQMWVHLKHDCYGALNKQYTDLIITKLKFHQNNRNIPGDLKLSDDAISTLGAQDVNNWFELAVEMLDYLDDLLQLQALVFDSMDMSRANSSTAAGQCRLAPLILCILDSSCLYDYVVKMMFKLHACLPLDVLTGHRDRFNKVFVQLKKFYYTSSNLQYFKYLITIPTLPDSPPNFSIASEFDSYVPNHAVALDAQSDAGSDDGTSVATLVDLGGTASPPPPAASVPQTSNGSVHVDDDRDVTIASLRQSLDDARTYVQRLQAECQTRVEQYENRILQMEHEAHALRDMHDTTREESERYREQAERLQNERNQSSDANTQLQHTQQQVTATEEKFRKMKDIYGKLRNEHIETLKRLGDLQKSNGGKDQQLITLQDELDRLQSDLSSTRDHLQQSSSSLQTEREDLQRRAEQTRDELFGAACTAGVVGLQDCSEQLDDPAFMSVVCSPGYLSVRVSSCLECIGRLGTELVDEQVPTKQLCSIVVEMVRRVCELVMQVHATAHAVPQPHANDLSAMGTEAIDVFTKLFASLAIKSSWSSLPPTIESCNELLSRVMSSCNELMGRQVGDVSHDELATLIDTEMQAMNDAIRLAADKIKTIVTRSRETNEGVRLEVNESILAACTTLMQAVQELVRRARDLQAEIVTQGRGTGSVHEFYKRNHQWTEGLLSAAKAIGLGATVLVRSADRVISGEGKFEELMAASREVAASTAQLVVASKVKADRNSSCLAAVSSASKSVTQATGQVIGNVKSGQQALQDDTALDFSHLSMHQAKQAEFDAQVLVMELETQLTRERHKLGELRKRHYQLADNKEE